MIKKRYDAGEGSSPRRRGKHDDVLLSEAHRRLIPA